MASRGHGRSLLYHIVFVWHQQDDTLNGYSAAEHRPPWTRVTISSTKMMYQNRVNSEN